MRAIFAGALASAAGFLAIAASPLAPAASAQVLGSQPYVPQPDPAVERLTRRVDALETDLRAATNRNEQLGFELTAAKRTAEEANAGRQAAQAALAALTQRVEALERSAAPAPAAEGAAAPAAGAPVDLTRSGPAAAAGPAQVDPATLPTDEAALLQAAKDYLVEGQVGPAQQASNLFIERFPRSRNAAEAQYTIGEALMIQRDYAAAAQAYGKLVSTYPQSEQAPMGLVKMARAMRLMNNNRNACTTLGLLNQRYPRASNMVKELAAQERTRASCS